MSDLPTWAFFFFPAFGFICGMAAGFVGGLIYCRDR